MGDDAMGLEMSIDWKKNHRYMTAEDAEGKDERMELSKLLVRQRAVVCRGTTCFSIRQGVVKFSLMAQTVLRYNANYHTLAIMEFHEAKRQGAGVKAAEDQALNYATSEKETSMGMMTWETRSSTTLQSVRLPYTATSPMNICVSRKRGLCRFRLQVDQYVIASQWLLLRIAAPMIWHSYQMKQ
ncbi:hypothetical protein EsHS_00004354 [Epichloe bromicola]